MKKIFIDGKAGTTGLRIFDRLQQWGNIELLTLSEEQRKEPRFRKQALNEADIAFLCLPDPAAIEAVSMVENPETVIIDTSTAHRTASGWVYGYPELSPAFEEKIRCATRIAVPGCHAGGFVALVYPLIEAGLLGRDALLSCHSLTGYSGGGKKMIAQYEEAGRDALLSTPRQYGLGQTHKHLKEMQAIPGLQNAPVFSPIVADFYSGMEVTVPLHRAQLAPGTTLEQVRQVLQSKYKGPVVSYEEAPGADGFLAAGQFSGKDSMAVSVQGNDDRLLLTAVYDNLGKGASGAALECLNLVMGLDKAFGLTL